MGSSTYSEKKEESTTSTVTFGFSEALQELLKGGMVYRVGWSGKNLFVFRQIPAEITIDIIPNMQSLPEKVKAMFAVRGKSIKYNNQLAIVDMDNNIKGWSPTVSDCLASDWMAL